MAESLLTAGISSGNFSVTDRPATLNTNPSSSREFIDSPKRTKNVNFPEREYMIKPGPTKSTSVPPSSPNTDAHNRNAIPKVKTPGQNPLLRRSLHVPAQGSTVLYGFQKSSILTNAYISEEQWSLFSREVQDLINPKRSAENAAYALMGVSMATIGGTIVFGVLTFLYHRGCKEECRRRFEDAKASGALGALLDRWNIGYFESRSLHVSVEAPDLSERTSNLKNADVTSPELSEYYWTSGMPEYFEESGSKLSVRKKAKYRYQERKDNLHAMKRFRIVVSPLQPKPTITSTP